MLIFLDELPVGKYLCNIDEKAEPMIAYKISNEIARWCEQHKVAFASADLLKERMRQIESEFNDINTIIQGMIPLSANICLPQTSRPSSDFTDPLGFEEYRRRLSFRLGPFQIARCISRIISAFFRHLKQSSEDKKKANQEYFSNKTAYMLRLAQKQIEMYSADILFNCLCETFLTCFESCLDQCFVTIPDEIEANYKLMENIMNEQRDCETLIQEYTPIENKCKAIKNSLLYFKLKYLSGCQPLILKEKDELGQGLYATVHLCEVDIDGKRLNCAVKRHRLPLTSDSYNQLSEVDSMR